MRALQLAMVALAVTLVTVPAVAQMPGGRAGMGGHGADKPPDGPKKKSGDDKDYKAALDRLPDGKYDPWRTVRGGQPSSNEPTPAPGR